MTKETDLNRAVSSKVKAKRAIYFDIDQNLLKKHYPYSSKIHGPKTYTNVYGKIQKYMETHGFSHRQYSGYESDKKITLQEALDAVRGLIEKMPWLSKCFQKIDITIIGKDYDLMDYVNKCASKQLGKENEKAEKTPKLGVHHKKTHGPVDQR